ncbi:uncharacterized protein LOC144406316 [Gasterosteus aculeatus]
MALHSLLWTKPPTPYHRPPVIHLCVVAVVEQRKVVAWEFDSTGARPVTIKNNVLASVSDGKTVAKFTAYEEFAHKFKAGGHYMLRGHSLRGGSPPYMINITKETVFFRSAPLTVSQELRAQAEALIRPPSPLTPLSTCRDAKDLLTVQGEVVEMSTVKKITKGRESFPMRHIKLQQGETQMPVCLWREAAVEKTLQIGTHVEISHLKATNSDYGEQLQSTPFTLVEELNSDSVVGVIGVVDLEGEPGTLSMLLEDGRTVLIEEGLWKKVEDQFTELPLRAAVQLTGNRVTSIDTIK